MRALLLSALAIFACGACSDAEDRGAPAAPAAPPEAGKTDDEPAPELPRSISILADSSDLAPRQELKLTIETVPSGPFRVRFGLPTSDGVEPLDAVLDRSEADTDEHGQAEVVLTAPSASTTFRVRASVEGMAIERELRVVDTEFTSVRVQPVYLGKRAITTWTASARSGESCSKHPGATPEDGAYKAVPAGALEAPLISDVPAGVPLAIVLRSGHFVSGCASIESLPPSGKGSPKVVEVLVLDRPIDLGSSQLAVSFNLASEDSAWGGLMSATNISVQDALLGTSSDDVDALLDAMRGSLGDDAGPSLEVAREAEKWDARVRARWGSGAATRVRDAVRPWLTQAQGELIGGETLLQGVLSPVSPTSAELSLLSAAGGEPKQLGFSSSALTSWSADSDDNVVLGTTLYFSSSRLLTGLAQPLALEGTSGVQTPAEALALALDCVGIGDALAAAGADATLAFDDCDDACMSQLCSRGLAALWTRARDATSLAPAQLGITAAGRGYVGDAAELTGISGTWVGELKSPSAHAPTGGALQAAQAPDP